MVNRNMCKIDCHHSYFLPKLHNCLLPNSPMNRVMLPSTTLLHTNTSPLCFSKQTTLWYCFCQFLWENNVTKKSKDNEVQMIRRKEQKNTTSQCDARKEQAFQNKIPFWLTDIHWLRQRIFHCIQYEKHCSCFCDFVLLNNTFCLRKEMTRLLFFLNDFSGNRCCLRCPSDCRAKTQGFLAWATGQSDARAKEENTAKITISN